MKLRQLAIFIALLCDSCAAASWDPATAGQQADRDFHTGHIKFYWCGTIASSPPGVPMSVAKRYPEADGGTGCVVIDEALRKRQADYSLAYNRQMLELLEHHR